MYAWYLSPQWFRFAMFCGISQHILNSPNSTPLSFFCKSPLETFGNKVTNRRPQSRWSSWGLGSMKVIFDLSSFNQCCMFIQFRNSEKKGKTRNAYKNIFRSLQLRAPLSLWSFWHISIPAAFNASYPGMSTQWFRRQLFSCGILPLSIEIA